MLYSYAKYVEKKAAMQCVHDVTIQLSEVDSRTSENTAGDVEKGDTKLKIYANGYHGRA